MHRWVTRVFLGIAAGAALAGCNTETVRGGASSGAVTLGPSPVMSGGTYSSGGGITVATELRNLNGLTAICGAWSESDRQSELTRNSAGPILQTATVRIGGKRVHQNLTSLRKVSPLANYGGNAADCIVTRRAWMATDTALGHTVVIPPQVAYQDRSGGGGSVVINFNPGKPGALSRQRETFGIALQDTETRRLSGSPGVTGGRFAGGGGLSVAVELRDIDGIAFVCGVWAETRGAPSGASAQVLAGGSVQMNGRVLIRDLLFLRQTRPSRSYGRQPARCASSGLPFNPGDDRRPLAVSLPGGPDFTPGGAGA